jgi:sulfide:quinone oxidoreductase
MSHKITIIGAGFAGLTAVRRLRKALPNAEITLIAPRPEFFYLPSLIWVPSGLRDPEDLRIDLEGFFRKHSVHFHPGRVLAVKDDGRLVVTDAGELRNDALIIASGARFLKGLPGIEHAIAICEGAAAAEGIKERLQGMDGGTIAVGFATNPKEPAAMRGGPMFELLFGLDTLLRRQRRRERFRLVFFNPAPKPGARLGERAVKGMLKEMGRRGIETHLGHKMKGFEPNRVLTEGGAIEADLILFMPGMTGPSWLEDSELPRSEGGLIKADRHTRVAGMERVYVAGDSGSFPGPEWMPKQAHMADLQAIAAVENLVSELQGRPATKAFRVELICIIDALDRGTLVYRDPRRALMIPGGRLFHWMKRFFEWWYLRQYRIGGPNRAAKAAPSAPSRR